jgi:hypothetical protein
VPITRIGGRVFHVAKPAHPHRPRRAAH